MRMSYGKFQHTTPTIILVNYEKVYIRKNITKTGFDITYNNNDRFCFHEKSQNNMDTIRLSNFDQNAISSDSCILLSLCKGPKLKLDN